MKKRFIFLQEANKIKNDKFEELKSGFFNFVKNNFNPCYHGDAFDDYVFFINKKRWTVRYDRGIKCWLFIIEFDVVLNKYDEIGEVFISPDGYLEELQLHSIEDENLLESLHSEKQQVISKLMAVQAEQKQGIRKIIYPKEEQCGCISRKDFYNGMNEEQRQKYWAFKFTAEDIKYIEKQPIIAPLTLREYFRLCRLYYLANRSEYMRDIPDDPKAAYMRFADGRTEQIETVDLDDPQDFYDWEHSRGRWRDRRSGGHPYEITAKTYLYPHYTDGLNGYYVWHGFIWNYDEAASLCREPNLMLSDSDYLVEIIKGNGLLKVTSSFNRYGYPNKEFQEPVNYLYLTRKQKAKIVWNELKEAQLKAKNVD